MIRLFFRTVSLVLFLLFLAVGLSFWKGGEPFRWVGEGMQTIGRSVSEFGDFVDNIIAGGKRVGKKYEKFRDIIDAEEKGQNGG